MSTQLEQAAAACVEMAAAMTSVTDRIEAAAKALQAVVAARLGRAVQGPQVKPPFLLRVFVLALLAFTVGLIACASSITPPIDRTEWPCGDPFSHYCPHLVDGARTCCRETEDCGGSIAFPGCPVDMCCANGGLASDRAPRPQTFSPRKGAR